MSINIRCMQTDGEKATELEEPVRVKTTPPGTVVTHTEVNTFGCVWEQIGLLLERYQQQTGVGTQCDTPDGHTLH
jgi:hypothetical protein